MTEKIDINLGDVSYPLFVGPGLIKLLPDLRKNVGISGQPFIIIDTFIYQNSDLNIIEVAKTIGAHIFCVNAGKSSKTFETAMKIFAELDKKGVGRDATIIAIGGGVVGDLAGFISSCWYRGVRLIHVPTTLLSAVDSCLGGKTAINFRHTVNAIGTYHHPVSIIVDTDLLSKLPAREISSGFGEIIKYSVLGANEITDILEGGKQNSIEQLSDLVSLCLKEKEKFVRNDVMETSNRLFLNFGHTIGHAIEFSTVFNGTETLRHGEGVALGMIAIFRICIELKMLDETDLERLKSLLLSHDLPIFFEASRIDLNRERLIEKVVKLAFKDKKRTNKSLRLVVLNGWGNPTILPTDDPSLIRAAANEVIV